MKQNLVKIKTITHITHDVLQIVTEKPQQFHFTFTCLPGIESLEFVIKTYPSHKSVTNELLKLKKNDELILHDVFGAIAYKGEGVFIAGGAGVTPFICIFRYLRSKNETGDNKLIFANKTKDDIILEPEFKKLLGKNFINILSGEKAKEYAHGMITEGFLKAHINDLKKHVYLCGPPPMMDAVEKQLADLKIDEKLIVKEEF